MKSEKKECESGSGLINSYCFYYHSNVKYIKTKNLKEICFSIKQIFDRFIMMYFNNVTLLYFIIRILIGNNDYPFCLFLINNK